MAGTNNELRGIDRFLFETLSASAAVQALCGTPARVFEGAAPEQTAAEAAVQSVYPCIVFSLQSGRDVVTVGGQRRAFTEVLYNIRAVNQEDGSDGVGQIADAIEQAIDGLQNVTLQPENITIMGVNRRMPLRLVTETNGKRFSTVGGLFRLLVSQAN